MTSWNRGCSSKEVFRCKLNCNEILYNCKWRCYHPDNSLVVAVVVINIITSGVFCDDKIITMTSTPFQISPLIFCMPVWPSTFCGWHLICTDQPRSSWLLQGGGDTRLYAVSIESRSNAILAWPLLHVMLFIIKMSNPYLRCPCAWSNSIVFIDVVQGLMLCLHYLVSWKLEMGANSATGYRWSWIKFPEYQLHFFLQNLNMHKNKVLMEIYSLLE